MSTERRIAAPAVQSMRVRPGEVTDTDLSAWRDLADRAAEPNPFLRPEFALADAVERDVPVEFLIAHEDGRWLALAAVHPRPASRTLPLPYLETPTGQYSLLGTPLLDRDALSTAADAIVRMVRSYRHSAALMLRSLAADGPVSVALEAAAARAGMRSIVFQQYSRAAWYRSADGSPSGTRLTTSARKELRRRTRLLSDALGEAPRVVDRTNEPAAWEAFLDMERSGWKDTRGTALASTVGDAAFFRRMCADLSAIGHLEVVSLEGGGRSVAMECHLLDGGQHFSFRIAHEPAYRPFAPGTQLKVRVIDRLYDQGLVVGDSCASPSNDHMNRTWPDQRPMLTLLLPTGARSAGLLRPAVLGKAAARYLRDDVIRRDRG